MKSIAVVLLNYNGLELLKQFLPEVIAHSPEADVILVDNGSTDASVAHVTAQYPELECICLPENLGYSGGYNAGLMKIKHPYYCLLNTDVSVPKGWLSPLLLHFETHPNTAALQPHIKDFKQKDTFEYAGAAGGYIDKLGIPFCRGRLFTTLEKDEGQYAGAQKVFWASGACFFVRSSVFHTLGGFDERFFAHQEEIDLCWRIHRSGGDVYALSAVAVYHLGGATLAPSPKKVFLNHRNSLLMLQKNLPEEQRSTLIFQRLCWDGLIGIHHLLLGRIGSFWAVIRAHFAYYRLRKTSTNTDKLPAQMDYFPISNSIIAYFLWNQKKFTLLKMNKKNKFS